MKTNRLVSALLCGAAISAVSSAALAQSAPPAGDQASAPDGTETHVEDVVVTGSRTIRNGNNSPSPVTVVQTDTGLTRTSVTDETGSYVLPNLPRR